MEGKDIFRVMGEWTGQTVAHKIRKMSNAMDLMACSSVIIVRVTQIEHWTLKQHHRGLGT